METGGKKEDIEKQRAYRQFVETTHDSVTEIGHRRGRSVRDAQSVTRSLFQTANGDATKVTNEEVEKAYDNLS